MIDCSAIEVMGVLAFVPAMYTGPAIAYRTLEETGEVKTASGPARGHIYLAGRLTRFNEDQEIRGEPTMIVLYHTMQREDASDRGAGTGPEGSRPRSDGAERAIDQRRSSALRGVP